MGNEVAGVRPRIGVTLWGDVPAEAAERYCARVREAGGEVVTLDEAAAGRDEEIAASIDGLLLTGGVDVDPEGYGAERHAKVKDTAPARDAMELEYLDAALRRDIPVLAICRGHQVLNVGFGGTLIQHIDSGEHRADFRAEGHPSRWHDVEVAAGSKLSQILGATTVETNSRHHQAVVSESLGSGLRPTAHADDHGRQLVEGVESVEHGWVVGVQWHPERLEEQRPAFAPAMRRLFAEFIKQSQPART
jgi:putative glutamine amidotransferase